MRSELGAAMNYSILEATALGEDAGAEIWGSHGLELRFQDVFARFELLKTGLLGHAEATGWQVSRGDVRRDVQRLLGGSFEDFLRKKL